MLVGNLVKADSFVWFRRTGVLRLNDDTLEFFENGKLFISLVNGGVTFLGGD